MRLGLNCFPEKFALAKENGFDYVDVSLKEFVANSDLYIDDTEKLLEKLGFRIESFNGFFPNEVKLIGKEADWSEITRIAEKNIRVAHRFGVDNVVIGSSKSRMIPEGATREEAMEQFGKVLDFCGNLAGEYGIKVAVEPLRQKETNFIHTVLDGYELCQYVGNPNLACIVDFFHFFINEEDLSSLDIVKDKLIHAHLARPNVDRCHPQPEDIPMLEKYAAKLIEIGYQGRLTLECNWRPDHETHIKEAVEVFNLFRKV